MKYIKSYNESNINNDFERILFNIAKQVRNYINIKYNLGGSFVDYCDIISDEVVKRLSSKGINGKVVYGEYYHQYEDSEPDYYGHNWVIVGDYIIDASREQFDSSEYVINISSKDSSKYNIKKIVYTF